MNNQDMIIIKHLDNQRNLLIILNHLGSIDFELISINNSQLTFRHRYNNAEFDIFLNKDLFNLDKITFHISKKILSNDGLYDILITLCDDYGVNLIEEQ